MVAKVWRDQTFSGLMGFVLKERLKGLKSAIKEWKLDMYGKLEEKKKELVAGILALDNKSEAVGLTQLEVASRKQMTPTGWEEGPVQVRSATANFYRAHFVSMDWVRPTLNGLVFSTVSESQNVDLIAPFTGEEIEEMISSCDGTKSPRVDGFNFAFINFFGI
ncbi:unnamed protein product [Trifolium pratense]|uniref:Uncharacterized protein n=1 Tax=Trifolium pratense TaxID=57577 RepID=A0ACB0J0U8_TRIPR|nr:unnamed protein product [Trifolium pratense]